MRGDSAPMRVVVATLNRGKLAEIRATLDFAGWEFLGADDLGEWPEPAETGSTFVENARIKAGAVHERFAMPSLADDSGLEVDALGGAPGVISSHYSGADASDVQNYEKLLGEIVGVPDELRTARFRCVMVFVDGEGGETMAEGTCEGKILRGPRGSGGFGYDPVFEPDATPGRTLAELPLESKNAISHRGAALRALRVALARA